MRRLAKQSREDSYGSSRDYQTLYTRVGRRIRPCVSPQEPFRLVLNSQLSEPGIGACWGGYLRAGAPLTVEVTFACGPDAVRLELELAEAWQRVGGLLAATPAEAQAILTLSWHGAVDLHLWGLDIGRPQLRVDDPGESASALSADTHLIPETFYLPHEGTLNAEFDPEASTRFAVEDGHPIELKKCSYCARLLPVDPNRLGVLAFHKHNAKRTRHQNECRACKKWRINDSFNPLRTVDQLHESSVITRERKLFLRESEILQEIKDRTGAGLKSKVWERFGRRCFRCDRPVPLEGFQLDHTRPLAYLWPIDEHATCLCSTCNNEKKEKFPVDFYSPQELQRLAGITGLSLAELSRRDINEPELARILADLPRFAREWAPRTFAATARKIRELRPQVDLMARLRTIDEEEYERLLLDLQERD